MDEERAYEEMDVESAAIRGYEDDDEDWDQAASFLRGHLSMGEL